MNAWAVPYATKVPERLPWGISQSEAVAFGTGRRKKLSGSWLLLRKEIEQNSSTGVSEAGSEHSPVQGCWVLVSELTNAGLA